MVATILVIVFAVIVAAVVIYQSIQDQREADERAAEMDREWAELNAEMAKKYPDVEFTKKRPRTTDTPAASSVDPFSAYSDPYYPHTSYDSSATDFGSSSDCSSGDSSGGDCGSSD